MAAALPADVADSDVAREVEEEEVVEEEVVVEEVVAEEEAEEEVAPVCGEEEEAVEVSNGFANDSLHATIGLGSTLASTLHGDDDFADEMARLEQAWRLGRGREGG